jgi:uncharacterized protein
MAYRLIRRSSYVPMPWRNGGGTTYEIARDAGESAEFRWRLSLARIDHPGPFSAFPGYDRAIALVSGEGCVLKGASAAPIVLDRPGAIAKFPGEAPVDCELRSGGCLDLNLMVRRPTAIVTATHLGTDAELIGFESGPTTQAVFCLSDALECVDRGGTAVSLELHDTLLIDGDEAARWRLRPRTATELGAIVLAWSP